MLVVDPSSSCDICLDPYNWNENERIPHIIACGHIFCRRCLRQVVPMKCPLCRKAFTLLDIQKVHVQPHEETNRNQKVHFQLQEETDRKKKYNLLRRLILTCDSGEEDVATVRKEVDAWLSNATEEHCPLRKTVEILDRLQQAKHRKRHDKKKIKQLEKNVLEWKSFVQQMRDSQSSSTERKLREIVARYQQEVEQLRAELTLRQKFSELDLGEKKRKNHSQNPLPVPPRVAMRSQSAWNLNSDVKLDDRPHQVQRIGYNGLDYSSRRPYSPFRPSQITGSTRDIVTSDDDAAYYTCPTNSRSLWIDEVDEALYQGIDINHY